ncbi:MAG TPA: hypothetical protein VMT76_10120 [Puia sp.]|nr:hypothetical protein [Puia sp.]
MNTGNKIYYLLQSKIDKPKWDDCITNAGNGLIYAYSYYLDIMSKNWDALVLNDYEAVMPLTWNKKHGVYYLYQPAFAASLGIFGNNLSEQLIDAFIQSIPQKFRLVEIAFNAGNILKTTLPLSIMRQNYILELNKDYTVLQSGYRENVKRNIKKASQLNCAIKKNIPVSDIIALSKPAMYRLTNIKQEDYNNFEKLYNLLYSQNKAITYGVYSMNNVLVASCAYFYSHGRAFYILVGNHPNGKTMGASHYLIDAFIKDHANQDILLDFEGSDIRNLAFFYSSFGAACETYPFLKINRLPFWMKWMKK